jgi:uncharacterized integral membrane protein
VLPGSEDAGAASSSPGISAATVEPPARDVPGRAAYDAFTRSRRQRVPGKAVVPVTDTARQHPPSDPEQTSTADYQSPPVSTPEPTASRPHRLPRSRAGGLWVLLVSFAVVLLLLLIFILQNGQRSDVYYLGAHGHLPLGVALLLAAVFGVLLVAAPAVVRIVQLRLMAARHRGRIAAAPSPTEPQKPAGS